MKALYYNAILGILLSFPSFLKAQIRPFEPLNPDRIFFKGKVVDTDNNALPKVSINIPGSMRGTISDSNGNFYIDAKPKETLYFTYAGKEDAYRQLQEKDTTGFIVQMQPRIQRLKNVHVRKDKKIIEKGEPYEDDRDGTFELVYADAYFPDGEEALYKFFKENQQYPQEAFKQGEEGEVLIQFTIDEKGKATDPKILRSVSPMLDQEAKRLVLSMPAWKPARQRGLCVESTFILPVYFHIDIWKQYTE